LPVERSAAMDQTSNPFAAPQTVSRPPTAEALSAVDYKGMRLTGVGLGMIYYGIVMMLASAIILVVVLFAIVPMTWGHEALNAGLVLTGAPAIACLSLACLFLLGWLLTFIGPLFCFTVPAETEAGDSCWPASLALLSRSVATSRCLPSME
jgi:hypothetical protein